VGSCWNLSNSVVFNFDHNRIFARPQRFEPRRRYRSLAGWCCSSRGRWGARRRRGSEYLRFASAQLPARARPLLAGPFWFGSCSPPRASPARRRWSQPWFVAFSNRPLTCAHLSRVELLMKEMVSWWNIRWYEPLVLVEARKAFTICESISMASPRSTKSFSLRASTWSLIQSVKMPFRTEAQMFPIHCLDTFQISYPSGR